MSYVCNSAHVMPLPPNNQTMYQTTGTVLNPIKQLDNVPNNKQKSNIQKLENCVPVSWVY